MRENQELKERLVDNGMYLKMYQEAESLVKSHMSLTPSINSQSQSLPQMINQMISEKDLS